jgi:hypothetical protein
MSTFATIASILGDLALGVFTPIAIVWLVLHTLFRKTDGVDP